MKAVCWYGVNDVRVARVPDPQVLNPRDAIVRITRTAICGSDLQLFDGLVPGMKRGDVLGHEFMGEVVEVGRDNRALALGDRVVVPFTIACGRCFFCQRQLWALCDNSNPNAANVERMYGYAPSGLFGHSHLTGGYAGGQAQFARVPFADVGPLKVPESVSDEQALLLSDVLPAGYMAAEHCGIAPGDTIAVWGCGPVGQFAIQFAWKLGAGRVIAIDRLPARLAMASGTAKAETIDRTTMDVLAALKDMTGGRGPDACIDAVGMESHAAGIGARRDRTALLRDGATALREAIYACRKGGTVSVPGVYGGLMDSVPVGAAFDKGLTLKLGHSHVQRYMPMLLEWIAAGEIDPASVITHRMLLDEAADAYRMLRDETAGCVKVVLTP